MKTVSIAACETPGDYLLIVGLIKREDWDPATMKALTEEELAAYQAGMTLFRESGDFS